MSFYIQPGWKLDFDLPDGGTLQVTNTSAAEGEIVVAQDGQPDRRQIAPQESTQFKLEPGRVQVTNCGQVPLLLAIDQP